MLSGVEIILERMKTNPEDFMSGAEDRKWMRLIDHAFGSELLTEEEGVALREALKNCRREMFNQRVMRALANEEQEVESMVTLSNTNPLNATLSGGMTLMSPLAQQAYNVPNGGTITTQSGISSLLGGIFK
jgi:hypothetical protein